MSDDDIVDHSDILPSPSRHRGKVLDSIVSSRARITSWKSPTRKARSPRKALLEKIEVINKDDTAGSAVVDGHTPLESVKRKRGRPPKTANASPVVVSLSETPMKRSSRKRRQKAKYFSDEEDDHSDFCDRKKADNSDEYTEETPEKEVMQSPSDFLRNSGSNADVKLLEETSTKVELPSTPSKTTPKKSISTDHDFTSPLKKAIMSNLNEYKDTTSSESLKLSRNFIPTPLPTSKEHYRAISEKSVNSFFDTFEGYFDQKKPIRGSQKSKNTMSMATEVTREEYALISNLFHEHLHKGARSQLYQIQDKMFPQYWFELTQGFSLLFYGVGSKREFLERYAFEYLVPNLAYARMDKDQEENEKCHLEADDYNLPCIVINGYNPTCNYRDVFKDISRALLPEELSRSETKYWGNHVLLQIQKMIELYKNELPDIKLVIIVHNLDGPSLRKDTFQTMLSYLALIRQVAIIASTDHIYAPILWDNFKAQNFNFVFHDITNYEPLAVESSFRDVMKMSKNDLASGAEGAKYVLESLTINSKKMYKLLIETQLNNMESSASNKKGKVPPSKRGVPAVGVEFKQLLHLCAADFIASNELSLRSMLTEFVEHKMATISKNPAGTEHVWVPYNYSEMKKLLEFALKDV